MHRAAVLPLVVCIYIYLEIEVNIQNTTFVFVSRSTHNYSHFLGSKLVTVPGVMAMTNELHPCAATLKQDMLCLSSPRGYFGELWDRRLIHVVVFITILLLGACSLLVCLSSLNMQATSELYADTHKIEYET